MPLSLGATALAIVACLIPTLASAQSLESFYRGKTINVIIGYPPAGANDLYARLVARHIGRHIPGHPSGIARNMPGGGSLVAANHIFNVAPKDGTVLGLIVPTAPLEERLGATNVRFKAGQFNWIGRLAPTPNVTFMNASARVKTIKDAMEHEAVLGATGRSSTVAIYPTLLNHIVGTKFKLVMGYAGSAEAMLAMERGEVEGHSTTWEGVKSRAEHHLRDKTSTSWFNTASSGIQNCPMFRRRSNSPARPSRSRRYAFLPTPAMSAASFFRRRTHRLCASRRCGGPS